MTTEVHNGHVSSERFPSHEQQAIIGQLQGPVLVLAPVGTGKTHVLATRLARAVESGMPPGRTLSVTFTNRAARELRDRVERSSGESVRKSMVCTFHSLCAWMLRTEADDLGLPHDFLIYDESDSEELLREICNENPEVVRELGTHYGREERNPIGRLEKEISSRKADADPRELRLSGLPSVFGDMGPLARSVVAEYHRVLSERNAMDFADLVCRVRAMLHLDEAKRRAWGKRFDWVQVDEVQDTHLSEYEVIAHLARSSGNLALFGDPDQTIYEWRGSDPKTIRQRFEADFGPPTVLGLSVNHRSTKELIRVAERTAASMGQRFTRLHAADAAEEGEPTTIKGFRDVEQEARWIAEEVKAILHNPKTDEERVAVLVRTKARAKEVSTALAGAGVPHLTVEQFEFFRRQEIKDCLARLRLVLNPEDMGALERVILRPAVGIGRGTMKAIARVGQTVHLRATDLVNHRTLKTGEPFSAVLDAWARGSIAVLDVESTGMIPGRDEVVEVAAVRLVDEKVNSVFRHHVRPTVPVGASESVHGYSDAFLRDNGRDAREVFDELAEFIRGMHVVGHNIPFDMEMLSAHASAVGCALDFEDWDDTLRLSRRLIRNERYDLQGLVLSLGLRQHPAHQALGDTYSTADLLGKLIPKLSEGHMARFELTRKHGGAFAELAEQFDRWRKRARQVRPAELIQDVLAESGLEVLYGREPKRMRNLEDLIQFFRSNDRTELGAWASLRDLTTKVALARNVDHVGPDDRRPLVVTVHQAKGLEFDTVFVAGLSEDEFPHFYSLREGRVEEERRLFYVAVTRPKRRLFLTWHAVNTYGYRKGRSRFLEGLA